MKSINIKKKEEEVVLIVIKQYKRGGIKFTEVPKKRVPKCLRY